jgi:hypothetical protein
MITVLSKNAIHAVSGGDVATTVGGWVGTAISEIKERAHLSGFELIGMLIAGNHKELH